MADIAGAVGSLTTVFIDYVVKPISRPINRRLSYLCCFSSNIKTLEDEASKLHKETEELRSRVLANERNGQIIHPHVQEWLEDSDNIKTRMVRIVDEAPNVKSGGCLKLKERFSLSKEAKETTKAMQEHLENSNFSNISDPPPPPACAPILIRKDIHMFSSRKQIEEEIMTTLEGPHVGPIGICGMGGVGKTTMAYMIKNKTLEKGLFDEVAFVVVSQPKDKLHIEHHILDIQERLAEQLGLKLEEKTLDSRAHRLRERLRGKNKTLVVLDDVWQSLNLKDFGMPFEKPFEGCRTLITSCNTNVLTEMNAGKICGMKILSEEESWFLFKKKVGTCMNEAIAKEVMKECNGLPLALFTVGAALKGGKLYDWNSALIQLRKASPVDIPNVIIDVYKQIKISYDHLSSENAKSTFLLCCLFEEDANIPLDELTYIAVGLRLYEDIGDELDEVRDRVRTLISMLKTRCLLLDGDDEDHVRMHDVVRDVSIFIASEEKRVKCRDCTWISSFVDGRANLIRESGFPKLKLLFIDNEVEQRTEISNSFIGETTKLNVLVVRNGLLKSLPLTTELRTSLTTLYLYDCESLESISVVGQFKSLEILICHYCRLLKELLAEAMGLERLKRLEILGCSELNKVSPGVISSLMGLEELKIWQSFDEWEGEYGEGKNIGLKELESLINLRCLEIQVWDAALVFQPLCLPPKLLKFDIQFGHYSHNDLRFWPKMSIYQMGLYLYLPLLVNNTFGGLPTDMFLTSTEYLCAMALLNANETIPRRIWDCPFVSNSFKNLKVLTLYNLSNTSAALRDCLLQLEHITIGGCDEMEQLVLQHEECDDITLIFPELKTLYLYDMPRLTSICKGIQSIAFPKLESLVIESCENMKCFVSSDDDEHYRDHDSLHLFCQPKVYFGNLKGLKMLSMEMNKVWCDKIPISFFSGLEELKIESKKSVSVFSYSIARNLVNLQELEIGDSDEMVNVIEDKEVRRDVTTQHTPLPLFPKLYRLSLKKMPKLESFCQWGFDVELPSLEKLSIRKCPEMQSFSSAGSLITPAIQSISIDHHSQDLESVRDVNVVLQNHFKKSKEDREQ